MFSAVQWAHQHEMEDTVEFQQFIDTIMAFKTHMPLTESDTSAGVHRMWAAIQDEALALV